jgi:hypothetical protein
MNAFPGRKLRLFFVPKRSFQGKGVPKLAFRQRRAQQLIEFFRMDPYFPRPSISDRRLPRADGRGGAVMDRRFS